MKIAVNCRILNKRHGGPKRFLLNLLKSISKLDKKNEYVLIFEQECELGFKLPKNFEIVVLKTKKILIFEQLLVPRYTSKNNFDVYFVTDPVLSPFVKAKKRVVVYHDIIYFEKDQEREFKFFENLHHKFMIPISAKYTDVNLCVSEFTESRVKKLLGLSNTRVILEGVEDSFKVVRDRKKLDKVIKKYNLKLPFIFYIGSLSPRKNVIRIIKAFCRIKKEIPHNLYLLGGYSWRDKEVLDLIDEVNDDGRIIRGGFIDEEDLPIIYNLANLYLFPSLYEGFGLPILEAQACGCPVLTSNISSMPEVAGKGGVLVNPYKINDIAKGIKNILNDDELQEDLVKKGLKNSKKFSWDKCAERVLKVFKD